MAQLHDRDVPGTPTTTPPIGVVGVLGVLGLTPVPWDSGLAKKPASRAGRALAYWRWRNMGKVREAAGQTALFSTSEVEEAQRQQAEPGEQ